MMFWWGESVSLSLTCSWCTAWCRPCTGSGWLLLHSWISIRMCSLVWQQRLVRPMQNRDSTLHWYNPHMILTYAFEVVFSFVLHSPIGVITAPLALYMPSTSVSLCGVLSSTLSCSQSWATQVNIPGFGRGVLLHQPHLVLWPSGVVSNALLSCTHVLTYVHTQIGCYDACEEFTGNHPVMTMIVLSCVIESGWVTVSSPLIVLSESWCCWMSTLVMSTGSRSGMFRSTGHLVLVLCDSCFSPMFL